MPRKRFLKLQCPICKKAVKTGDTEFPFCSDRCRTIDLGKWGQRGVRDHYAAGREQRCAWRRCG